MCADKGLVCLLMMALKSVKYSLITNTTNELSVPSPAHAKSMKCVTDDLMAMQGTENPEAFSTPAVG